MSRIKNKSLLDDTAILHFPFLDFLDFSPVTPSKISPVLIVIRNRRRLKRIPGQTRFFPDEWRGGAPEEPSRLNQIDRIRHQARKTTLPRRRKLPAVDTTICRRFEFLRSNFPSGIISSRRQSTFVILLHRRDFYLR